MPELRPLLQIRRQRGEAPFGYFNHLGGLRRLAGRGLSDATKKTLIAAVGWNRLRRLSPGAAEPAAPPLARHRAGWKEAMRSRYGRIPGMGERVTLHAKRVRTRRRSPRFARQVRWRKWGRRARDIYSAEAPLLSRA